MANRRESKKKINGIPMERGRNMARKGEKEWDLRQEKWRVKDICFKKEEEGNIEIDIEEGRKWWIENINVEGCQ